MAGAIATLAPSQWDDDLLSQADPRVSVIVPAYGVADLVGDALRSLQAQSLTEWEAIVVDDGAPDDVAGACQAFAGDPRIRLLMTDNGGLAAARNRGIAASHAPFIALLDGDDEYEPEHLATMLAAIERDAGLGFVTCDAVYTGLADRAGQLFSAYNAQEGEITLPRVMRHEFHMIAGSVMRRAAFDDAGGYDPALRSVEDLDIWCRILAAGWRAGYVDRPLVRYRRRPGSLSMNSATMARSACVVYAKLAAILAGRPEEAVARAMLADSEAELRWIEGQALVQDGDVSRGLEMMRGNGGQSLRWKLAMPLMKMFPGLARPLLKLREHLPPPSRG
jgi:glycosyltransferase involved in cell wall biosynthesis